jgi:hypothetical protein
MCILVAMQLSYHYREATVGRRGSCFFTACKTDAINQPRIMGDLAQFLGDLSEFLVGDLTT